MSPANQAVKITVTLARGHVKSGMLRNGYLSYTINELHWTSCTYLSGSTGIALDLN